MANSEWSKYRFSDAVLVNPAVKLARGLRYPFVDMGALTPGLRSTHANEEREFSGGGSRFQHGDTLMARITPCLENGKVARYSASEGSAEAHGSTEFIVIRGRPDVTDTDFAYYLTQWDEVRNFAIDQMTGTSGRQRVPTESLNHLDVLIPPLTEQRQIAHILGTLDDKIELNRRMNQTLEEMARALFKSWFVDFDPVRAKAEDRYTGLPPHLAALFPDSFEDSELGEIPSGWGTVVLDDLTGFVVGGDWGSDGANDPKLVPAKCIRGADIPSLQAGGIGKMPVRYLKPSSLITRDLRDGDIVIEISGGSPTQSTGRAVLISDALLGRLDAPLVYSNFCRLLRLKSHSFSSFVYVWLRFLYSSNQLYQFETGTTGIKNFGFTFFSSTMPVCMPPEAILARFNEFCRPLLGKMQANAAESDVLCMIRDALLPKLISGELRIATSAGNGVRE